MTGRAHRSKKPTGLDAITLSILWNRLVAIVDEASATLYRTSFSPVVRESNDYACVLLDAGGNSLAQSTLSIPSFIGTLPRTVRHLLERFPSDSLEPGDVLISNDPWLGTGHLNDINIMVPVFHSDRMVAISASTAHVPDIGGRLISPENKENYEEGLRIPATRLYRRGVVNQTVLDFISHNVRVPEQVLGDVAAQVAANELAASRMHGFIDEYRMLDLSDLAAQIQSQSEQATREDIRRLPADRDLQSSLTVEGPEGELEIKLRLHIDRDRGELVCDYAGTSPQQWAAINVVPNYAYAYTAFGIKCVIAPDVPNNEGCFRPVTVTAPEGSLLNPRYPAAGGARSLIGHYLPALVFNALAEIVPERVRAAAGSPNWAVLLSGAKDDGRGFAGIFFINGGMGGASGQDGLSAVCFPSNASNTPTEVLEQTFPIEFICRELVPDTGGLGQWRGGLGQVVKFRFVGPAATLALWTSHTRHPAPGLLGGQPGALGCIELNGKPIDPNRFHRLRRGDVLRLQLPGGGGFGDPSLRSAEAVELDRLVGMVGAAGEPVPAIAIRG